MVSRHHDENQKLEQEMHCRQSPWANPVAVQPDLPEWKVHGSTAESTFKSMHGIIALQQSKTKYCCNTTNGDHMSACGHLHQTPQGNPPGHCTGQHMYCMQPAMCIANCLCASSHTSNGTAMHPPFRQVILYCRGHCPWCKIYTEILASS